MELTTSTIMTAKATASAKDEESKIGKKDCLHTMENRRGKKDVNCIE